MSLALRPTFSESWYRVVSLRPRLRPTAQVSRQYYRGERWYVVRDPAGNQFHRLSDPAYRFIGLLDGSRTVGEAWDLVGGQLADDAPTQPEVLQILSQLFAANLIETDVTPDSAVVLKRQKMHYKRKMQQRMMNLLFPRIPLWDPDTFIKTWMPVIRVMLSWLGVVIWLVVVLAAVVALAPMWTELQASARNAVDPANWLWLWATFVIIKFVHEMGHAFSCRRFGGEVHEVGIMFLVLIPTPYVDASSAWAFANKWKRLFVGAGGMIFELFVAAVCVFVWRATYASDAAGLINQLAYNTMLIASVSTILFNANPLLRYDGYYILSDYWEIPNLQRKASEYTLGLVKRHIFRVKQQQPLPPVYQRVQLFFYAIASSLYRVFVSLAIAYMLFYTLPDQAKIIGLLMGTGALVMFLVVPLFKMFKYLATEPELHRKRGRAWAFTGAVAAAIFFAVGVVNFPVTVRAEGVLEAADRHSLFVTTPGVVRKIHFKDGTYINAGETIAELENRDEVLALALAKDDLKVNAGNIEASRGDPSYKVYLDQRDRLTDKVAYYQDRVDRLTIKAPINGWLVAPDLANLTGSFVPPSKELGQITRDEELEAFVVIEQADRDRLQSKGGYNAELRVVGQVADTIPVSRENIRIQPSAKKSVRSAGLLQGGGGTNQADMQDPSGRTMITPQFEARIRFENSGNYFAGQKTFVRFKTNDPEPIAVQCWRWFKQITMNTLAT